VDSKVIRDHKASKETLDFRDQLVQLALRVLLELQVFLEFKVLQVQLDKPDHRDFQGNLDSLEILDKRELLEVQEPQALVHPEQLELLGL